MPWMITIKWSEAIVFIIKFYKWKKKVETYFENAWIVCWGKVVIMVWNGKQLKKKKN